MLLKGMGESFILSEDKPLTPNIDGVMALWIFRRRAQTAKSWQKLDLSILVFDFLPPPPRPLCTRVIFPGTREPSALGIKTQVQKQLRERGE